MAIPPSPFTPQALGLATSVCSRRRFLGTATAATAAAAANAVGGSRPVGGPLAAPAHAPAPAPRRLLASPANPARVALTTGDDRQDNLFRALQMLKREIAEAIGRRLVILKPNVVIGSQGAVDWKLTLSTTHVDALDAVLEFLRSIGKTDVVIAESSASDRMSVAYDNLGYGRLPRRHPVRLLDLNQEGWEQVTIWNGGRAGGVRRSARISRLLLDPEPFVISVTRPKTHNCVLYTLSLKNVAMAAPIHDVGYTRGQPGSRTDKPLMHGNEAPGFQDLNDNLHLLACRGIVPDLAVLDGYEGMEGDGPIWGTAVPHRVAVVSLDWLAADRVGLELMGATRRDPNQPDRYLPPYLRYCAQSGLGQFDLQNIAVEGARLGDHLRDYALHRDSDRMLGAEATPRA